MKNELLLLVREKEQHTKIFSPSPVATIKVLLKGKAMLSRKDVALLINNCAHKMNVPAEDVFTICACSDDNHSHDPDVLWADWRDGKQMPRWFTDVMILIMANRIPLVSVKAKKKD